MEKEEEAKQAEQTGKSTLEEAKKAIEMLLTEKEMAIFFEVLKQ